MIVASILRSIANLRGNHATTTRILKNVVALSVAQVATYLLPVILLPYTAAVLGPQAFGRVAFTQAIVQYSILLTNFGFSYSATRLAALSQNDHHKLAEIVVNVWTAKFLLMLLCSLLSAAAFAVAPSLRPHLLPYICAFATVVGSVLYVEWFFQAIEEMKWITIINVIPKLIIMPMVFVFIKTPQDYIWLLLLQSLTFLTSGVAGALLVFSRLQGELPRPTLRGVVTQFKEGWQTFIATLSINLYTSSNTVFLGLLSNSTVVGYYSAGQKIVGAIQSLWTPASQALYPHFCKSFRDSPRRARAQLNALAALVAVATLLGSLIVCLSAPWAVPQYLGARYANSIPIIQVLIFTVFAVTMSNLQGMHGMLAAGLHRDFLTVASVAAGANLILAPMGILLDGALGLAMTSLVIELWICGHQYLLLRRKAII